MYLLNDKKKNKMILVAIASNATHKPYSYFLENNKINFVLDKKYFCFRQFN